MSKIINSFSYAVTLEKSMSHGIWKYETRHGNSFQVSVLRAMLWKINSATTHGKLLLIISLKKIKNNIFWQFFHNYGNNYNANIFTLI